MNNWSKPNIAFWIFCFFLVLNFNNNILCAQEKYNLTHEDSTALEDVIVERYYEATEEDCADTTGGILPKGSVTYRIFVDLKTGYKLQTVFAETGYPLIFTTSTSFYNHTNGHATGEQQDNDFYNVNNYALDTWLTMNAASNMLIGILKKDDHNGSVLIKNQLKTADGLMKGTIPDIFKYGFEKMDIFEKNGSSQFLNENFILAVLGGIEGPTADNMILIGQFTTNGLFSFKMNIQVENSQNGAFFQFVSGRGADHKILNNKLSYGK